MFGVGACSPVVDTVVSPHHIGLSVTVQGLSAACDTARGPMPVSINSCAALLLAFASSSCPGCIDGGASAPGRTRKQQLLTSEPAGELIQGSFSVLASAPPKCRNSASRPACESSIMPAIQAAPIWPCACRNQQRTHVHAAVNLGWWRRRWPRLLRPGHCDQPRLTFIALAGQRVAAALLASHASIAWSGHHMRSPGQLGAQTRFCIQAAP